LELLKYRRFFMQLQVHQQSGKQKWTVGIMHARHTLPVIDPSTAITAEALCSGAVCARTVHFS
jgi:hypothetical protein